MDLTTAHIKDRTAGFTPSPTEPLKHQLLATLAQHRMASTRRLHVLLRPDRSRQSVSERLNDLLGERLVDFVVLPQSHRTRGLVPHAEGRTAHPGLARAAGPPAIPDYLGHGRLAQRSCGARWVVGVDRRSNAVYCGGKCRTQAWRHRAETCGEPSQ